MQRAGIGQRDIGRQVGLRSSAKPLAPLPPPAPPPAVGSIIRSRNCVIIWNALVCAPVASSPSSWVSAFKYAGPDRLPRLAKPGGSAPPLVM